MKLSFNGATTMKADLATDIKAAGAAGFDYLEIWAAKLREFLKNNSVVDLKKLFAEAGIAPLSINSIEHVTFRDAAAYLKIRIECEELCAIAQAIACPYVVVVPGKFPRGGLSSYEVMKNPCACSESWRLLLNVTASRWRLRSSARRIAAFKLSNWLMKSSSR